MKDRVPLYPGRVKMTPVAGQENVYDMERADQPTQEGTPLNKNSLLTDATAALFQLGADAVPDDVLAILSEAALVSNDGESFATPDGKIFGISKIQVVSYRGTNTFGASNPCSISFNFAPDIVFPLFYGQYGNLFPSAIIGNWSQLIGTPIMSMYNTAYKNYLGFGQESSANNLYGKKSEDGKTVQWYETTSAINQLNKSQMEYYFVGMKVS